jgi:hypothetical protein
VKVHRIDFDAVKRWRLKLREPLAQAARARMNRGDALADAVAAASTMKRIDDRAAELLAERGDGDVSLAAVEAAWEVLGVSDER